MKGDYHTNDLKSENLSNNMAKKYNKLKKGDKNETDKRKNSN